MFKRSTLKSDSVKKLYTDKINLYHFFFVGFLRYAKGLESVIKKGNYLKDNFKVLDAGCGSGVLTKILYQNARAQKLNHITFHGFDLTPAMLERFKNWINQNNISNINLLQADVLKIDNLPDGWSNYDLVASSAMLEYLPKDKLAKAISNLKNLLKPECKMIIFITRKNFINKWLIEKWWQANIYTKEELTLALNQVGFSEIKFKRFPFPYSYKNLWCYILELKK
ncbi:MAG: class I SAM-dependent methyltransferase [Candidatus Buchananbacteria bacterium CG10_big_fil_rev_8_21_14_0_10_42_9]|uniref:Class I SAM-dependent methyltransferase n=1 Tax=Candidatus Buchananbacteria bacterium CG10_big_fil_rev_8_21_14_0_10_42_9 TaxID=1974526 RepID=A0A2H0W013_9BACT|nr:MAG: class I SAM-dependent methyltransferase [Candidatus Buchananbacteria bacterium CG10_big_fil_rev_8_21_14_0_10_42_9]